MLVRREFGICLLLFLITLGVYWSVTECDFIRLDDEDYVTNNSLVQSGLNRASIVWAFKSGRTGNWHPLTWISHMADCQMYGLNPHGHHLTSLLFHAANAALLFVALRLMTGAVWRSAVVAALFAWHPLHVESVAWVSERKDVLSTFFEFLTLIAYARYAALSRIPGPKAVWLYLLSLLLFTLGLLSKPMLVTVPFLLLLLDWWPLGRFSDLTRRDNGQSNRTSIRRLVLEKIPFLILAALASAIAYFMQSAIGSVAAPNRLSLGDRLSNAEMSYVRYLRKMFWPGDLTIFYPMVHWPLARVAVATLVLTALTIVVWRCRRERPSLLAGWLWYLGMLVPVIGLIQVGSQAMADRYTYVPLVGVFIMLVWAAGEFKLRNPYHRIFLAGTGELILAVCLFLTWSQVQLWRNSITLFSDALEKTPENGVTRMRLGSALADAGHYDEAMEHFRAALKDEPGLREAALCEMGYVYMRENDSQNAIDCFRQSLQTKPDMIRANLCLAIELDQQGKLDEACAHYEQALQNASETSEIDKRYGLALARQGKGQTALAHLYRAVQTRPGDAEAQYDLACALVILGRRDEAMPCYRAAVRLQPTWADALNGLAWLLATHPNAALRNGPEAVRLAGQACIFGGNRADYLGTLDAAYAEAGRYAEAVAAAQNTVRQAQAVGATNLAAAAAARLNLYQAGRPYHQE